MSLNEADTCRIYVTPKLQEAGWETSPHTIHEQKVFTDGRVLTTSGKPLRADKKRADYLLNYTRDFMIAVVEAKPEAEPAGTGMQQAKDYAEILGLKFAYATNGHGILEFDYTTGQEQELANFPTPKELWQRLKTAEGLSDETADRLLTPAYLIGVKPRYYQEIAIHRAVQAILQGQRRCLLTMATGTGKTVVAFQIAWKLWNARWNCAGEHRKPRILFLADRNILVDDPKDKTFAPFGEARFKIEGGQVSKGREIYFAIYQALAKDERRPGLYRQYARDFFDLIVVDECHRGSARDESNWREILEYFEPAYQLGMTATPLREDNRDTYQYFGKPLYTYSLKQGIEDGFLAPYRVHRVITTVDASGWRPSKGEVDRYGREIPDGEYRTEDFERIVALRSRTTAIAHHLTEFMKRTDRFAKTIVFCVDQEHADEMRRALANLNQDLVKQFPNYVARVTSDEGGIGRGHLSRFQELETTAPVILTTSQLLTTGVDAPTCKNVVIVRIINSMSEFKQIIGRGTRIREDYGKLYFNILDYTGSATRQFADPSFDGFPEFAEDITVDEDGNTVSEVETTETTDGETRDPHDPILDEGLPPVADIQEEDGPYLPRKYYVDGGEVRIIGHQVLELDADGKQLRTVQYTDYTADKVRTLFHSADELQDQWANPLTREKVLVTLEEQGITFDDLATISAQPEADPLDLLCHVAFRKPIRTRRERASRVRSQEQAFFDQYAEKAREILNALLDKYSEHGPEQLSIPNALQVPPLSQYGNVMEIAELFGGPLPLKEAVDRLQTLIYTM